ncbi:class I SAM-dependent methyltransferase [Metasolibacillus meyeri]|uniref:class I SAM-dependent methyltransferase n=1 Tax=Metasolibacillus meyeri TaxID=1071052 RepID=UPI000D307755|nr:class I SAM-dependent methyltransferase [Metasolibacillus meyeri]
MAWDNIWEKIFLEREWGKYPPEELIRFIAKNFYNSPNRQEIKILEVGCGQGANVWYIAREGFAIYAIDGSPTGVLKTRNRLDNEVNDWKGEIIVGDMLTLPYQDDFFDAVIDIEAVSANNHEDAKRIFKEIFRVLKTGGTVITKHFAEGSWGDKTGENIGYNSWLVNEGPMEGKGLCRFASQEDMEDLLEDFEVLENEMYTRTYNNLKDSVREWIYIVRK